MSSSRLQSHLSSARNEYAPPAKKPAGSSLTTLNNHDFCELDSRVVLIVFFFFVVSLNSKRIRSDQHPMRRNSNSVSSSPTHPQAKVKITQFAQKYSFTCDNYSVPGV